MLLLLEESEAILFQFEVFFHWYTKIFLFKSSISNLISDTKKIGRRFAIDSQGNRRIPRSIIRVQRRGRPKKHIQPPFASCFMQIQTQSFANQRENICIFLPWNTSSWKVFTKKNTSILPLKQTGYARVYIYVYVCVCVCVNTTRYSTTPLLDRTKKERILRVFSHLYK